MSDGWACVIAVLFVATVFASIKVAVERDAKHLDQSLDRLARNSAELGYTAKEKGLTREDLYKLLEEASQP